jgi:hypothetical protein
MQKRFPAGCGIFDMNRPSIMFTGILVLIGILFSVVSTCHSQTPLTEDQVICNKIFSSAFEQKLIEKPIGDVVTTIGQKFLGAPYVGGTLDSSADEHLIVNLRGFDCVTLIENMFALARAVKLNTLSFDGYKRQLQTIRYRDGIINGYASRLNYFSEWIKENQKKNIIADVTKSLGGIPYRKTINFMTEHRASYRQLAVDSTYKAIQGAEKELSANPLYYIPKKKISSIESKINTGDIIAITTSIKGLDISHTGIAIRTKDGSLHLLHAPDKNGVVHITTETLGSHLLSHKNQTGIMVIRPLDSTPN